MRRGAAARYSDEVLEIFYGPIPEQENRLLPPPLNPQRLIHPDELNLVLQRHAFLNWLSSYKMVIPANCPANDITMFYRKIRPELLNKIRSEFDRLGPIKVNFTMQVRLKKDTAHNPRQNKFD